VDIVNTRSITVKHPYFFEFIEYKKMASVTQNVFSEEVISYLNGLQEVVDAKAKLDTFSTNGVVYFTVTLTDTMRAALYERLGLDVSHINEVPMRWIKGDTAPHIDSGATAFNTTYLMYLNNSPGELVVDTASYPITQNTAYVFDEGLLHETLHTEYAPRLLLGPMNEMGMSVGAAPCFTANSQLLTPAGYVKASDIKTDDILVTADGRHVPIKVYTSVFKVDKTSAPYLIPKNSLARNVPAADLSLSPWHAVYLGNGLWQKPQTAAELNPGTLTQYDIGKDVRYYHFEAPNYFTDNFICEGTVVESFSSKQVSSKNNERIYTWSEKHQAYTRNEPAVKTTKHIAM